MFKYMLDNNITTIIQFGDLFDRRKYMQFKSLTECKKYFFDKIVEYNFKLFVFLGNHDIAYRNTLSVNSPELLIANDSAYKNHVTVINKPMETTIGKTTCLIVPWICDDNQVQCMEMIEQSNSDLCFGHFEMQGFEMHKGALCEHGLPKELFWKFKHVYSGHFHHKSTSGNISYLGTPYQITWADYGDERGFYVLDTAAKNQVTFIENQYENFYKINYDDTKFTQEDLDKIDFSKYNYCFVRLLIKNKTDVYLYEKFLEGFENVHAIVQAVEEHKFKDVELDDEESETESVEDTLKQFCATFTDSTDTDKLSSYIINLYNKASLLE